MNAHKKNYLKFAVALAFCLLVRLVPLRAPNVEPILATAMPLSRVYGAFGGFSFAVLSIFLYDMLTNTLGVWTLFTAAAYGVVGAAAAFYFKNKNVTRWSYVRFAVAGTLFFDAVT